jgi:hypothetical protein
MNMTRVPKPSTAPQYCFLRSLAGFFRAQREFNTHCIELLDAFTVLPEAARNDLAALLTERQIETAFNNFRLLWDLVD